jgi:hypothetical protein
VRRRWDGDERGHGIASGDEHVPHAERLVEQLRRPDWVAEDPDLHLRPHLEATALALGFGLRKTAVDGATYEIRLDWLGGKSRGELRRAAYSLIGSVAEESTHVAEWVDEDAVVFDVATGTVSDAQFAPHGHLLRLRIQVGGPA